MNLTRFFFASSLALALAGCGNGNETGTGGSSGSGGSESHCEACAEPWTLALGGDAWSTVLDMASDASGNVVLMANLSGEVPGLGLEAVNVARTFVAKLDPAGQVLWTRELPEAAFARLALDAAGHVFLAGSTDNTSIDLGGGHLIEPVANTSLVFLAELDDNGEHLWSRAVATSPDEDDGNTFIEPLKVTLGPGGTLVLTGNFTGPLDFGAGELDLPGNPLAVKVFVAAFDDTGHPLWSERFGSQPDGNTTVSDTGMFLADTAVAENGSVWLAGAVYGVLHVGDDVFTPAGRADGFLARLDAGGHPAFTRLFGGAEQDGISSLALGPGATVAFSGSATGTVDLGMGPTAGDPLEPSAFVASMNANGAGRWATRLPAQGNDTHYAARVGVDSAGQITTLLVGSAPSVSLLTLDGDSGGQLHLGSFVATTSDGTEPTLTAAALALDPDGNPLVGGALRGNLDLGSGVITAQPEFWGAGAFIGRMAR